MHDQADLGRTLSRQLQIAQREHMNAMKVLDEIVSAVPSGLPHPDGAFRVEQVGREYRRALASYRNALHRYTDFVLHGIIPEDLG